MSDDAAIPLHKPFLVGHELDYIAQAVSTGNLAGDGHFTKACSRLLEQRFKIPRVLLTNSCTAALEMAAMLCGIKPGDEVIMPSYTYVSTANAFVRLGAKPVFVDVRPDTLNLNESLIEEAITDRTRVIVPVHYAGVGCDMDRIMAIAKKHGLLVVEDAAQAVDSYYRGRALGSIGHLGCYSFHETKNNICGQGGALCINDHRLIERAEIIRDKGTDRQRFLRGEVDRYEWIEVGSAYASSEICAAFLYGQLQGIDFITARRRLQYSRYAALFRTTTTSPRFQLPGHTAGCRSNAHSFFLLAPTAQQRTEVLTHTRRHQICTAFHFIPLHLSPMGAHLGYVRGQLPVTEDVASLIVRLPMFFELSLREQARIASVVLSLPEQAESCVDHEELQELAV